MNRAFLFLVLFFLCVESICVTGQQQGDVDGDQIVDLHDITALADQWLNGPGGTADLVDNDGVNLSDYAVQAQYWLQGALLLTEFMADNKNYLSDGNGTFSDWIEIHNQSRFPISLSGWYLTDDPNELQKWAFPDNLIIASNDYLLLFASGQPDISYPYRDSLGYYHTNFKLDAQGEYLALVRGSRIMHEYRPEYPRQSDNVSYGISTETRTETTWIAAEEMVRVLVPADGALGTSWTAWNCNDTGWYLGSSGIGYETSPADYQNLIKTSVPTGTLSFYSRFYFTVEDAAAVSALTLRVKYDDGFVAYINGVEVARSAYAPAVPLWNSVTTGGYYHPDTEAVVFEDFDLTPFIHLLNTGSANVLAIHTMNNDGTSSDLLLVPELVATLRSTTQQHIPMYFAEPTPGTKNQGGTPFIQSPVFSHPTGLFTENFTLALSTESSTGTLRYTTDGAEPSESSAVYSSPIPIASSTTVKAAVYEPGVGRGITVTRRYMKLDSDVQAFTSNLPIVVVDTLGSTIGTSSLCLSFSAFLDTADDGRAVMTQAPDHTGRSGIRARGFSSAPGGFGGFLKFQYALETWDENNEDKKYSLLGFPEESDWILQGPYSDKTLMRNYLIYNWSNDIGRYAVRTRFVEMFLNSDGDNVSYEDYIGIYVFMEKIKRDPYRVDITKLEPTDNAEPEISGGYMYKIDRPAIGETGFTTAHDGVLLVYVDPQENEITSQQKTWIKNYMDTFEPALYGSNFTDPVNGYAKYVDVDSFIDAYIMVELAKNVDGFIYSTYMYKDRGGKLTMGPIWDYNLSLGNANYRGGWDPTGWFHNYLPSDHSWDYQWWRRMFEDPEFTLRMWDRWFLFRSQPFTTRRLLQEIDSAAALLNEAQQRNFTRWPVLGTYVWPNPDGYATRNTYQKEIDWMKNWLQTRLTWIDVQCPYNTPPAFAYNGSHVPSGQPVPIASGGVLGGSLKMDGSGDYVTMTGYQGIPGTQSRTVSAWINTETVGVIVSWGKNVTGQKWTFRVQDYVGTVGAIRLEVGNGWMVGETDVRDGRWHHVAVVLDSDGTPNTDELQLYVDGRREAASNVYPQAIDTVAEADVKIGAFIGFPEYFNGRLDDVRIYDRAVSDTEIAALANLETPPTAGLVGHWKLDETLGTVVADSAASHPGTITGNPLWQPAQTIYYTLDGSDPRQRGGAVSPAAYNYTTDGPPLLTENTTIRARTYAASKWSTLLEEDFLIDRGVVINEFMALNNATLEDPDEPGEYPDWIELYNPGPDPVDLGGMYLTDKLDNPTKWRIATGITLQPGDYLLFWADDDGTQGPYHTNFKLDQYGEAVALFAADGVTLIDSVVFGDQKRDISYGRSPDGSAAWGFLQTPTPQYENSSIQPQ